MTAPGFRVEGAKAVPHLKHMPLWPPCCVKRTLGALSELEVTREEEKILDVLGTTWYHMDRGISLWLASPPGVPSALQTPPGG